MEKEIYIVSSRKNLDNEDAAGSTSFWKIPFEGNTATAPVAENQEAFVERLKNKNALVLVHGYNNDWSDVIRAYSIIAEKVHAFLGLHYDYLIGYTWPGGDNEWEWYSAKKRSSIIAPMFEENLRKHFSALKNLDIMTHSLGSRVAMKAIGALATTNVRGLYQMASAVDNESIETGEEHYLTSNQVKKNVVFHSKRDAVLKYAYTAIEWDAALGYSGPENPADIGENTQIVNCKHKVSGHGRYKYTSEIYQLIGKILSGDEARRFITL